MHTAPHLEASSGHGSGHVKALPERSQAGVSRLPWFVTDDTTEQILVGNGPVKELPPRPSCTIAFRLSNESGSCPESWLYSISRSCKWVKFPMLLGTTPDRLLKDSVNSFTRPLASQPTRSQSHTEASQWIVPSCQAQSKSPDQSMRVDPILPTDMRSLLEAVGAATRTSTSVQNISASFTLSAVFLAPSTFEDSSELRREKGRNRFLVFS